MQPAPTRLTLGTLLERVDTGAFIVTRSTYAPRQTLPTHAHALASATIVLRGTVVERITSRRFECSRDRVFLRPAAVVHSNAYGTAGAECVIIGARSDWVANDGVARTVFSTPTLAAAPSSRVLAQRMRRELAIADAASALAIEGLAFELVASAARTFPQSRERSAPRWLHAVREQLHDEFTTVIRLHVIARDAGVHPVHLARAFRRCFGCSPGEYVRQCRIDRACNELAGSQRPIVQIALDAGFSSPSHFATAFRRATGFSPTDYRAAALRRGFRT